MPVVPRYDSKVVGFPVMIRPSVAWYGVILLTVTLWNDSAPQAGEIFNGLTPDSMSKGYPVVPTDR